VNADDPLAGAIGDWQRKHHIADGDPMIAVLELVRIYLKHSRETAVRKHSSTKLPISSLSCAGLATTSIASTEHASSRIAYARHLARLRAY
jgi:hypothetical protein